MRCLLLLLLAGPAQAVDHLATYCVACHNAKKSQGELNLADLKPDDRKAWREVGVRVSQREMPPEDAKQPTAGEREALVKLSTERVKAIDAATPSQPGRVTMRRLNRVEYRNTVRDLLGVTFELGFDPTRDFPADGAGYGFDSIGDVLSVSPLHMEKYLAAATQLLERAIVLDGLDGPRTWTVAGKDLRVSSPLKPKDAAGQWPTNWIAEVDVRQAGEYRVKATLRTESKNGTQAQMAIQTEGGAGERFTFARQGKPSTVERKVKVLEAGRKSFWLAYQHEQGQPKFEAADADHGEIVVESLEISGPYFAANAIPDSHKRLIVSRPAEGKSRTAAADEVLAAFLPRAFRRPVPIAERKKYLALFEKADAKESYESALLLPFKAALVSPHFLYRVEIERPGPDGAYELNDHELACRLSYFLWSTMPDEALFRLADAGKLKPPEELKRQVSRMLKDGRAMNLSDNFVSQWLQIRGLDNFQPEAKQGKLSTRLRIGMAQEPVQIFHEVLTTERPVTTLLNADFTYANAELAKHYKLPPVAGHEEKQKQTDKDKLLRYTLLPDAPRGGLLTTAAVLTATSHPDRTSPVKRGKWVLDALLGAPPPPPPPMVESLKEEANPKQKQTLRQRLEAHRTEAACASCHKRMDPLGFAFEHYDVLGRYRDKDGTLAIDDRATLPDGKAFDGVPGLRNYLLSETTAFTRCLAEKMLTYGIGRGVEPFDAKTVEDIVRRTEADGGKLSAIVHGIVQSPAFRQRSSVKP